MAEPLTHTAAMVAIPTLVGGEILSACLAGLERQSFRDFEVIVINNSGNPLVLETRFCNFPIRVLDAGCNLGFGAAVNLAIRASRATLIATLNDDTEPDPGWLEALVREMSAAPGCGLCASKIRLFEPGVLDSAGMLLCSDGTAKQRGGGLPAHLFTQSDDALFPSACAALYSREMLDEIGLFDEEFFLYCEDTDLGLRARWAGWNCRFVAAATVKHHYSWTARAYSPLKAGFVERNRIWVAIKNFPLAMLLRMPFAAVARYVWQLEAVFRGEGAAAQFIGSGESLWSAFGIVAQAWRETLLQLPSLLAKRRRIRALRRIGVTEFRGLLERHRISVRELARA